MYPVPNTYGNGTQIYGTLGRQQRRQQRPLSSNSSTLQLNGRPRSQRIDSDGNSSIILNPATGNTNLIESNSFPQGSHIMPHHLGQVPCVTYNPNEWMNPLLIGMQPQSQHEGSVAGSSITGGLIGENNLQADASRTNPINPYNMHLMPAHGGSQLQRGGSIPSASDTSYIPDLEDGSYLVNRNGGGSVPPLPMLPLSDQRLVRYSTIGRAHNRYQNYQPGNTVTSPR